MVHTCSLAHSVDSLINQSVATLKRSAALPFVLAFVAVLSACGGGEPPTKTTNTTSTDNINNEDTATVVSGQLNDTGIDRCTNVTNSTWVNNAVCSALNWGGGNLWGQQQDAYFGRDAQAQAGTLTKVGSGMAGFDFTRIGASGKLLAKQDAAWSETGTEADGTRWDCVRDNVTGLVWEVKRNNSTHLRHKNHAYFWDPATSTVDTPDTIVEGGNDYKRTGGDCTGVANTNQCSTKTYVTAVNLAGLCGRKDWRLPTVDELRSLAHTGRTNPAIDVDHFPNTPSSYYWSASPHARYSNNVWAVSFEEGHLVNALFYKWAYVRLVRSGQ